MPERRTAEDALNMTSNVKKFIARGMPSQHGNAAHEDQLKEPEEGRSPAASQDGQPKPAAPEQMHRKRRSRPRQQPQRDDIAATHPKASVQKTVRFQPRLIAEWEAYVRKQEASGHSVQPFQQVQNEALELWLEKHARRKTD